MKKTDMKDGKERHTYAGQAGCERCSTAEVWGLEWLTTLNSESGINLIEVLEAPNQHLAHPHHERRSGILLSRIILLCLHLQKAGVGTVPGY